MRVINSEIQINSPIDKVWETLTEFKNWHEWNPTVNGVEGNVNLGEKLVVSMKGKDCKDQVYSPTIIESEAPNKFVWQAKMLGGLVFTNERRIELEEMGDKTLVKNSEAFSGLMIPLMWQQMQNFVPGNLKSMNEALKVKLES